MILFKSGKWSCAGRRYSQALKQLILIDNTLSEQMEEQEQLKAACLLNLSACQGKLGQYDFVALNCTKVRTECISVVHFVIMTHMYKVICSNIAGHIKPSRLKTIVMQPIELHVAYLEA